mmetsp:Transcript_36639/g.66211  ORF Transcript_36639/g.66211 Transcript_36639/m.66211 type:complete len:258 (+) Transcript_36639:1799-2572(+)
MSAKTRSAAQRVSSSQRSSRRALTAAITLGDGPSRSRRFLAASFTTPSSCCSISAAASAAVASMSGCLPTRRWRRSAPALRTVSSRCSKAAANARPRPGQGPQFMKSRSSETSAWKATSPRQSRTSWAASSAACSSAPLLFPSSPKDIAAALRTFQMLSLAASAATSSKSASWSPVDNRKRTSVAASRTCQAASLVTAAFTTFLACIKRVSASPRLLAPDDAPLAAAISRTPAARFVLSPDSTFTTSTDQTCSCPSL